MRVAMFKAAAPEVVTIPASVTGTVDRIIDKTVYNTYTEVSATPGNYMVGAVAGAGSVTINGTVYNTIHLDKDLVVPFGAGYIQHYKADDVIGGLVADNYQLAFPGTATGTGIAAYVMQGAGPRAAVAAAGNLWTATAFTDTDYLYIGFAGRFTSLDFDITPGAGTGIGAFTVEYSTGANTWSAVAGLVDNTTAFTTDGTIEWTAPAATGAGCWVATTDIDGGAAVSEAFYVRITPAADPGAACVWTVATTIDPAFGKSYVFLRYAAPGGAKELAWKGAPGKGITTAGDICFEYHDSGTAWTNFSAGTDGGWGTFFGAAGGSDTIVSLWKKAGAATATYPATWDTTTASGVYDKAGVEVVLPAAAYWIRLSVDGTVTATDYAATFLRNTPFDYLSYDIASLTIIRPIATASSVYKNAPYDIYTSRQVAFVGGSDGADADISAVADANKIINLAENHWAVRDPETYDPAAYHAIESTIVTELASPTQCYYFISFGTDPWTMQTGTYGSEPFILSDAEYTYLNGLGYVQALGAAIAEEWNVDQNWPTEAITAAAGDNVFYTLDEPCKWIGVRLPTEGGTFSSVTDPGATEITIVSDQVHGLVVGSAVTIFSELESTYSGQYTVTDIPDATSFRVDIGGAGFTATDRGTWRRDGSITYLNIGSRGISVPLQPGFNTIYTPDYGYVNGVSSFSIRATKNLYQYSIWVNQ